MVERSLSEQIDDGWGVESPRYPVAVVVHSIDEVDDTLGCRSQLLSESPVLCFPQSTSLEADGKPQPFLGDVGPALLVDSNA